MTKQSLWRPTLCWQATSAKRHPYMSNQPCLGFQLAQLGRDASAAVSNSKTDSSLQTYSVAAYLAVLLITNVLMRVMTPECFLGCSSPSDRSKEECGNRISWVSREIQS